MNVSREIQPQYDLVSSLEMQTRNSFDEVCQGHRPVSWVGVIAAPIQFLILRDETTPYLTMFPYTLGIFCLVAAAGTVVLVAKVFNQVSLKSIACQCTHLSGILPSLLKLGPR